MIASTLLITISSIHSCYLLILDDGDDDDDDMGVDDNHLD